MMLDRVKSLSASMCLVSINYIKYYLDHPNIYHSDAPHFIVTPDNIIGCPGDMIKLSCRAEANPLPRVTWKKDNRTNKVIRWWIWATL